MVSDFIKITPHNGFDKDDINNSKQNNNAGPMADMGEYIYVCTGRNVIYSVLRSGKFLNMEPPAEFNPSDPDMGAEIWRYKKDGSEGWQRVYKVDKNYGINTFDFITLFPINQKNKCLYVGCSARKGRILILKSTDGVNWNVLNTNINMGCSITSMTIYNRKIYVAVADQSSSGFETLIFSNDDPENKPWELVGVRGEKDKNPYGRAMCMKGFNHHLYIATALPGGFEVWRTRTEMPKNDGWKLIVDKGAGDAANEIPFSMNSFNGRLYVGTGIQNGIQSIHSQKRFVNPRGFDIIRIDMNDRWRIVVGGRPAEPTTPSKGERNESLSGYPSGFGNMTNGYCWQIQSFNDELYVGTWNWSNLISIMYNSIANIKTDNNDSVLTAAVKVVKDFPNEIGLFIKVFERSFGFDLWKTKDGVNWTSVSLDGFGNNHNYGIKSLFESTDGKLYVGTANPFEGCEVWVNEKKRHRRY